MKRAVASYDFFRSETIFSSTMPPIMKIFTSTSTLAWRTQRFSPSGSVQRAPVVFVTNELGAGIVPENRLAREFRDAAGLLNQWVAAAAEEVTLAVCGLPLKVK